MSKQSCHLSTQRGFTLVEMMIGLLIGLLCTLVIAAVLSAAEGQRRGTTQGTDALIAGSLALFQVQREVAMGGYGFASEPAAVGCQLDARFNGAMAPALPPVLAPVIITAGGSDASDQVRVLSSSKAIQSNAGVPNQVGYTIPMRTTPPQYAAGGTLYTVYSAIGASVGDLMVAVVNAGLPCEMFQVTGVQVRGIQRATQGAWNAAGFPAQATQEPCSDACLPLNPSGSFLVNMGQFNDWIYTVDKQQRLTMSRLNTINMSRQVTELQSGVVMLKAMYGHDGDGDGAVDTYDNQTPADQNGWLGMLSVRLAVVARSTQYEKEEVTQSNPLWDVGSAATVAGAKPCGASMCVELKVDGLADWKHYRYQVFDTIVPLRNQRWKSKLPVAAPPAGP